jgi:hypothetical protein
VCASGGSYQHGFTFINPYQNGGRKLWRWSPKHMVHIWKAFFKTTGFQVSSLHKGVNLATAVFPMADANSLHKPCDQLSFFQNSSWGLLFPKTHPTSTLDIHVEWYIVSIFQNAVHCTL